MKHVKIILGFLGIIAVLSGCKSFETKNENNFQKIPPGRWRAVDYIQNIKDFVPDEKQNKSDYKFTDLMTYKNGHVAFANSSFFNKPIDGYFFTPEGTKKYHYYLKNINNKKYLFFPYMNYDAVTMGKPIKYVVYREVIIMNIEQLKKTNFFKFSKIPEAQKLSLGDGVKVAVMDWFFDMNPKVQKIYADPVSLIPGVKLGTGRPWHGSWMVDIVHRIAPKAKIIPIRIRIDKEFKTNKENTESYQKYIVEGIKYAADHGASVVTTSTGPVKNSVELRNAVKYAESKGCIFVDVHPEFSEWNSKYDFPVEDSKDKLSNLIIHTGAYPMFGDVILPDASRDIYTWGFDTKLYFKTSYGFSNAPPIVGGVIALIKSVNPALTPEQIRNIIYSTARYINGFKVINAEAAVKKAIAIK